MTPLTRLWDLNLRNISARFTLRSFNSPNTSVSSKNELEEKEFRVLNLRNIQQNAYRKRIIKLEVAVAVRCLKMPIDQNWTSVWPGPRTFHPASVPLPLRQGFTEKTAAPPSKFANAELIKIPNFLHLTPPSVKQQCEALKKFCTAWPKYLATEVKWNRYPIKVISTDFCHSTPSIRNPESRRITITVKLSDLKFDTHARDKFLRMVKQRYNPITDVLTVIADRCPLRKQNYNYATYLITACYHESFITEPWETSKSEADMEYYFFNRNKSKESSENIINWHQRYDAGGKKINSGFAQTVEKLINEGENESNLKKYKKEVYKLLQLSAHY